MGVPFWVELGALEAPKITPEEREDVEKRHEPVTFIEHVEQLFKDASDTATIIMQEIRNFGAHADVNMLNAVYHVKRSINENILSKMEKCLKAKPDY